MRLRRRGPSESEPQPDERDDAALVAAARAGSDAFEALYQRYWERVMRHCYYELADWQEAEDAAIQIFADVHTALCRFEDRDNSFRPWLFTIAHHEIAARKKRLSRRPATSLEHAGLLADPSPGPEDQAMVTTQLAETRALLVRLPDRLRQVAELFLAGLSDKEIAAELQIDYAAARQAKARAFRRIAELLGAPMLPEGTSDA